MTQDLNLESSFLGETFSMTLNALICDDEASARNSVKGYLEQYCEEHDIVCSYDCFDSGEEAKKSDKFYNIAFLDIEMGNTSGVEVAEHLKEANKNIIIFFITAYGKYIDDAMNLYALRFLSKPIDAYRFYSGMDRAVELINEDVIEFFMDNDQSKVKINANDIIYVETVGHKTKIVCSDREYYTAKLLDDWEKILTHSSFYRIHKSYILNLDYIYEYQRDEVRLTNSDIIPVSYRKQTPFRKYFYEYLRRRK